MLIKLTNESSIDRRCWTIIFREWAACRTLDKCSFSNFCNQFLMRWLHTAFRFLEPVICFITYNLPISLLLITPIIILIFGYVFWMNNRLIIIYFPCYTPLPSRELISIKTLCLRFNEDNSSVITVSNIYRNAPNCLLTNLFCENQGLINYIRIT